MSTINETTVKPYLQSKIHPLKFALWVGIGSILMIFASLTSAYVVRQAAGNWIEFRMPGAFYISTALIIGSSILLHLSFLSFKKGKEKPYKYYLLGAGLLGVAFLIFQYQGWLVMMEYGLPLRTNASGDFTYILSWLHAGHVLGGLLAMAISILVAFSAPFMVTANRKLRLELVVTYWHFVDILWIYLLLFFILQ